MTVLIRNFYFSFCDTVSVEITMKLENVKSRSGRMKYFIFVFCHEIPEIMGCVATPWKCCGKEFHGPLHCMFQGSSQSVLEMSDI